MALSGDVKALTFNLIAVTQWHNKRDTWRQHIKCGTDENAHRVSAIFHIGCVFSICYWRSLFVNRTYGHAILKCGPASAAGPALRSNPPERVAFWVRHLAAGIVRLA